LLYSIYSVYISRNNVGLCYSLAKPLNSPGWQSKSEQDNNSLVDTLLRIYIHINLYIYPIISAWISYSLAAKQEQARQRIVDTSIYFIQYLYTTSNKYKFYSISIPNTQPLTSIILLHNSSWSTKLSSHGNGQYAPE